VSGNDWSLPVTWDYGVGVVVVVVVDLEVPATVVVVLVGTELGMVAVVVPLVLIVVLVEFVMVGFVLDVVAVLLGGRVGTVVVVCTLVDGVGLGATVVGGLTVSPRGPMYTTVYGGRTRMYVASAVTKIPIATHVDTRMRLDRGSFVELATGVMNRSRH